MEGNGRRARKGKKEEEGKEKLLYRSEKDAGKEEGRKRFINEDIMGNLIDRLEKISSWKVYDNMDLGEIHCIC